jgi:hypothetical protein
VGLDKLEEIGIHRDEGLRRSSTATRPYDLHDRREKLDAARELVHFGDRSVHVASEDSCDLARNVASRERSDVPPSHERFRADMRVRVDPSVERARRVPQPTFRRERVSEVEQHDFDIAHPTASD